MLIPPVKIDDLHKEWSVDKVIDATSMEKETLKVSHLHGKYLHIRSYHNMLLRKIEADYKLMKGLREDYYHGFLNNPEDLEKYGWEPQPIDYSNPQVARKLDADPELNKLLLKRILHEQIVKDCDDILKSIHNRSWDLGNFIKYKIFQAGQ